MRGGRRRSFVLQFDKLKESFLCEEEHSVNVYKSKAEEKKR